MKVRNKNENVEYLNHLEIAIDLVQQAIDCITYSAYPEMNRRTIAKLESIINALDTATAAPIFKP